MENQIKLCCENSTDLFICRYDDGISLDFVKMVSSDDYKTVIKSVFKNKETKITEKIVTQSISFCPFCGTNLNDLVKSQKTIIKEYIEKQK